jgi:hypothetical protein
VRSVMVVIWAGVLALNIGAARAQGVAVDLELILAVDISQSVDPFEAYMQRQGYVRALSDPQVIEAIQSGYHGRIAITYIEWGGPRIWITIADWRLISSEEDAIGFSQTLGTEMLTRGTGTSISGVLAYASTLFNASGFHGERRVIDISGDGPNSSGGIVSYARDDVVAAGITVNGLAINNFEGGLFSLPDLDVYYQECVVGGPGAFVVAADGFESFAEAILRKLILEIADAPPPINAGQGYPQVLLVQAPSGPFLAPQKYAPECDIGERMRLLNNPGLRNPNLFNDPDAPPP